MPVFQETSSTARDLRILPSRAPPLPRLSRKPDSLNTHEEHREVVVIGVSLTARPTKGSAAANTVTVTGRSEWPFPHIVAG